MLSCANRRFSCQDGEFSVGFYASTVQQRYHWTVTMGTHHEVELGVDSMHVEIPRTRHNAIGGMCAFSQAHTPRTPFRPLTRS